MKMFAIFQGISFSVGKQTFIKSYDILMKIFDLGICFVKPILILIEYMLILMFIPSEHEQNSKMFLTQNFFL